MIAPPHPDLFWRCMDCCRDLFAPSILDTRRCLRCAATRYAWRRTPFGRLRIVPPKEAAMWTEDVYASHR